MSILEALTPSDEYGFSTLHFPSVIVAIVTNNEDPDELGRVKLRFPWLTDDHESDWARISTPMAGAGRGLFFLPEVEDEVLVAFEHGDVRRPIVIGCLWNGQDTPPETNSEGGNDIRVIKSRSGHQIRLNDKDGEETIELIDKTEANSIVFDAANNTITISADQDIAITAPNGKVSIDCSEFEVSASSGGNVSSDGDIEIAATGSLNLSGSTVNIN